MNPRLQALYSELEIQRSHIFELLSSYSKEQLEYRAEKEKWSVCQIISHLITAEKLSIDYIRKKIQGVEQTSDSGIREELKMLLLKISQRIPGLKFKAPRYIVENTPSHQSIESLKQEWDDVRNELYKFLEQIENRHLKRKIYKHARVGYMNIQHAVLFFKEHVTHHTPQIKKLLKK